MKQIIRWTLALAVSAVVAQWNATSFAQFFGGPMEEHATLTIKPDGSCQFVEETVQPRTVAEQQVRSRERIEKMAETMDEEESGTNSAAGPEAAPKPFTDDELGRKFQEMMNDQFEERGDESAGKVSVEVKKDSVRMVITRSFATLEEMLKNGSEIWWQEAVSFENVRFEKDTNGLLRVTLTPRSEMQRYFKNVRSALKLSGVSSELKLVFPGKVLTSGFPGTQTNSTWLAIDGKRDETIEAVEKLYNGPVVITAELGGLKLEQPLELKKLAQARRGRGEAGDELPVTDAGPGFVAEAQTITTTTLRVFPDGENYFKQGSRYFGQQTGTVVSAKLFAPKGRSLQSAGDVRVLKAVDNQGRVIPVESEDEETGSSHVFSSGSPDANSAQIQLRLQLPQPDAQAIDELAAEAIVVTAGAWKEMTLTNIQQNATNELDLAGVLPGAKLIITKFTSKNRQLNLQAQIKGPPTVRRLDVQAKIPGTDNFNSNLSERNFRTKGNESTRTISIQGYGYSDEGSPLEGAFVLVVRYPEDLRRERVNFKLKGLDLL